VTGVARKVGAIRAYSEKAKCVLTFSIVQFLGQLNAAIIPVSEKVAVFNTRHSES
jgi:hypothetical protein